MLIALVVGVGLLGLRYAGVPDDVRAVRQAARQFADQVAAMEPATIDGATVDRLTADLERLDGAMAPVRDLIANDPLVGLARSIPYVGEQLDSADALVVAADALLEAGGYGLDLADEVITLRAANEADQDFALMPGLVELMATSGDEVDHIAGLIALAETELGHIPDDANGQILEARDLVLAPLVAYLPLLDAYRKYDDVLPGLLGWGAEKRYLVLAQNPAELRPSGGYIGTVGIVSFLDGAITSQDFTDIYQLDLLPDLPFVEPPAELAEYLLGNEQSWRLADANWSADFPTSAQRAVEFYEMESGDDDIDGVIAITTYALDRLLEVVGPVPVPKYDITVEPGDTTLTLLGATRGTPTSLAGRKEVLDVLAKELTKRLLSLPPERLGSMVDALEDIGNQQLALAWFPDAAAQGLVDDVGWDGRMRQEAGDFVYVVESNVAPTSKYNLVVDRADSLVVDLDETGDATNSLRLDWQNDAARPGQPYRSLRDFSNNEEGWYGAYLRAYVPGGSELITASGQAADQLRGVEREGAEAGRTSFANYLFMPPGDSTLTYLWQAPGVAIETEDGWVYELVIQKQPGARSVPVSLRIDLPQGAVVGEVSEGLTVEDGRVLGEITLDRDIEIRVAYELP